MTFLKQLGFFFFLFWTSRHGLGNSHSYFLIENSKIQKVTSLASRKKIIQLPTGIVQSMINMVKKKRKENERGGNRSMKRGQRMEDEGEERKIPGVKKHLKILEL